MQLEWGLLPRWWKPSGKRVKRSGYQRKCVNAVSEEVTEKPSYREAFKRRRCLMPASEFQEQADGAKALFHLPDRKAFMLAALWERWTGADEVVESCTMMTTAANAEVRSIGQDRMPLVFTTAAECARWLDPEIVERGPLEDLMRPLIDGALVRYAASGH